MQRELFDCASGQSSIIWPLPIATTETVQVRPINGPHDDLRLVEAVERDLVCVATGGQPKSGLITWTASDLEARIGKIADGSTPIYRIPIGVSITDTGIDEQALKSLASLENITALPVGETVHRFVTETTIFDRAAELRASGLSGVELTRRLSQEFPG
jgi:hypothetical protein